MLYPNLFLIGAAKAATTSTYEYLKQHPDIFLSHIKEPFFFVYGKEEAFTRSMHVYKQLCWPNVVKIMCKSKEAYLDLFSEGQNFKYRGEGSIYYVYQQEAIENMKLFVKKPKMIFILRNPLERAYVMWSYMKTHSGEQEKDFYKALLLEEDRKQKSKRPPFHYLSVGKYGEQIQNIMNVYGPELKDTLLVLNFEDFILDQNQFLNTICDFLEIDNFKFDVSVKHNSSGTNIKIDKKSKKYMKSFFKSDIRKLSKMKGIINFDVKNWLKI